MKVSIDVLRKLIMSTNGKFAKVVFRTKKCDNRTMIFRVGVKKGLIGGVNKVSHIDKYITVYDVVNKGYRNVNLETVKSLKCGKVLFEENM